MSLSFSGQFYMAMVLDHNAPNEFHVAVWELAQPQLAKKATYLKVKGDNGRYSKAIAFENETDFRAFNTWWTDYKILVGDAIKDRALPEPGDGEVISGVMVKHAPVTDWDRRRFQTAEEFLVEWSWIVETCSSKVWWTPCHWIFQSQEEAVMFKLHGDDTKRVSKEGDYGDSNDYEYDAFTSSECTADDYDDYDGGPVRSLEDLITKRLRRKPTDWL